MLAIETKNLSKYYKKNIALDNVNLKIEKGRLYGLLGLNGAGKTTLVSLLCGLIRPDGGSAYVYGHSITEQINEVKKLTDISPQESSVAHNLTVRENLEFFADLYSESHSICDELAETFALKNVLNKKAKTLSGGYARRLSIAIALVSQPKVLFLDEPTLGLDVVARRELWRTVKSLKGSITVVLTTHYLEEVEYLCDSVGILKKGKLIAEGTVEELKRSTSSPTFEDAFIKISEEHDE